MIKAIYIGGPTVIIDIFGIRFITDPTFDSAGTTYSLAGGKVILEKLQNPITTGPGHIDYVLLSHDQHPDNLDTSGRALLDKASQVFTTKSGSARLGGSSIGLDPWEKRSIPLENGGSITITATPARHGPAGTEKMTGDVIGFLLTIADKEKYEIYITGDTVFYEGVAEVSKKYSPSIVFLFAGAARTRGPFNLTMGTNDAIDTAFAFPGANIIPLHFEGWKHFTENETDLKSAFEAVGIKERLHFLRPGISEELDEFLTK